MITVQRDRSLDQLKSISMVLMFMSHGARLVSSNIDSSGLFYIFIKFLLYFEPVIAGSFLFCSGFSLSLSLQNKLLNENWIKDKITQAFKLIAIAITLFFFEFGLQFPGILVSPNILSTIAYSSLITLLFLKNRNNLIILNMFIFGISVIFSVNQWSIEGITSGPGAVVPIICFYISGFLMAKMNQDKISFWIKRLMLVTASLLILDIKWVDHFSSFYNPSLSYFNFIKEQNFFWNHSPYGFLGCLFFILVLYKSLGLASFKEWDSSIAKIPMFSYLFHLIILGLLEISGTRFNFFGYVCYVIIITITLTYISKFKIIKNLEKLMR